MTNAPLGATMTSLASNGENNNRCIIFPFVGKKISITLTHTISKSYILYKR
jgi:hypothetical protein